MNPKEAKKILPKKEYEAIEAILMNQISRMGEYRLKQKVTQSRRLSKKYRDMAKRQGGKVRGLGLTKMDPSLNARKSQIFRDILVRLEQELEERGESEGPS